VNFLECLNSKHVSFGCTLPCSARKKLLTFDHEAGSNNDDFSQSYQVNLTKNSSFTEKVWLPCIDYNVVKVASPVSVRITNLNEKNTVQKHQCQSNDYTYVKDICKLQQITS